MVLADVELIAVEPRDNWRCELDTRGKLYLEGEIDVEWHPPPRSPRTLQEGKPKWSWRIGPF